MRSSRSVRSYLLTTVGVIVTAFIAMMVGVGLFATNIRVNTVRTHAEQIATVALRQIDQQLQLFERNLVFAASLPEISSLDPALCDKFTGLLDDVHLMDDLPTGSSTLATVDSAGRVVCRSGPLDPLPAGRPASFGPQPTGASFGAPRYDDRESKWVIDITTPIVRPGAAGLLIATLDLESLQAWLDPYLLPGGAATILDSSGTVLGRAPHDASWPGRQTGWIVGASGYSLPENVAVALGLQTSLYGYATSDHTGWRLVIDQPQLRAVRPVSEIAIYYLVNLISVSVGAWVLTWWTSSALARPLRRLAQSAIKIGDGLDNVRVQEEGPAEIAQVARSLNDAIARLKVADSKVRSAERRASLLSYVVDRSGIGIVVTDPSGVVTFCNQSFTALTGIDSERSAGQLLSEVLNSGDMPRELSRHFTHSLRDGATISSEFPRLVNNEWRWFTIELSPAKNDGVIAYYSGILQDITERKAAEDAVRSSNTQLAEQVSELEQRNREISWLRRLNDGLQQSETSLEAIHVISSSMASYFRNNPGRISWYGLNGNEVAIRADWGAFQPAVEDTHIPIHAQERLVGEITFVNPVTRNERPSLDAAIDQIAMGLTNIAMRERLSNQAIRDGLTGVFNRRHLSDTLPRKIEMARSIGQPLSLMLLDIDHFKSVNDRFGHATGDLLLQELAEKIVRRVRDTDLVCRYGGEEFTVVLPGCPVGEAYERADLLRRQLGQIEIRGAEEHITVSIGVAALSTEIATDDALLKAADEALYLAKSKGRNLVVAANYPVSEPLVLVDG